MIQLSITDVGREGYERIDFARTVWDIRGVLLGLVEFDLNLNFLDLMESSLSLEWPASGYLARLTKRRHSSRSCFLEINSSFVTVSFVREDLSSFTHYI